MNLLRKQGRTRQRSRRLFRLAVAAFSIVAIMVSYLFYTNYSARGSVSASKFLTANGSNAGSAAIAANTYANTTTTTANSNYYALRETADSNTGLTWNFTGWNPLNTATEAAGSQVTKVSVFMDAGVGNSGWSSNGNKTFRFRMYNWSNGTYDLLTTATRQLTTRTYAVFSLDFPSPQDYTDYFDASGNFRIQLENTADGDSFATYLRIEYLYVNIYYDKTTPNVSWSSPSGNPAPYYTNAASVTLQANGDDNTSPDTETTGVSKMDFYYNNGSEVLIGTDTAMDSGDAITGGTWSYAWNAPEGSYSVYARSVDGKNNVSTNSATQTIIVDRTAPAASITAPTAGGKISGNNYAITGSANDTNFDYYKVEYSPAGANTWTQIGTNQTAAVTNGTLINWDTTSVADGNYDIRLTVYDKAANTQTSTVAGVTVDNTAPSVSLAYYSDAALTQALPASGGKSYAKAGTVYVKLVPNETLRNTSGDNQLTIDAPGTANDVTNADFTWNGSAWVYTWTVVSGNDGDTASITVKATDLAGNAGSGPPVSGGTVAVDNTPPVLSLEYYSDANLTTPAPVIGGKPQIKTGTTYVKLVSNEPLSSTAGDHKLTLDAPGTVNDVNNQNFVWDAAVSAWKYAWNVSSGNDGDTLSVSVTGKDLVGLTSTGVPSAGSLVTVQTASVPTTLTITANPTSVVNDNTSTSTITAHLADQYGTALSGRQIDFTTNLGTISASSAITNAGGDATITIKSGTVGIATITGTLNNTSITGTATVSFNVPDFTAPTFDQAAATSKQIIYLTFSELIQDPNTSGSTISISGSLTIGQTALMPDALTVKLVLSGIMGTGNQFPALTYTVTVQNIKDLAGNNLASATQSFTAFTPHGDYSTNTAMCGLCHATHSASGQDITNQATITQVCFVCHGVTGTSDYKAEGEFTSRPGPAVSASLHKSLDSAGNNALNCTDCHNPHGDDNGSGGTYPKLLRSTVGASKYYQGNNFCFACHGSTDKAFAGDPNYYTSTGGNHINASAVHYDTAIQGGLLLPASGTEITCVKCHEKHGSQYPRLIDNTVANAEEKLCYKCHGDTTANNMESGQPTKLNIYRQFNIAPAPAAPALSYTTTGGFLMGDATYYFKVTAYSSTSGWESLPSTEALIAVPAGSNTNKITVSIPQYSGTVDGFDSFKVYMSYRGNAPNTFTLTRTASDGSLTAGTYYIKVTAFGPFGETFVSGEKSIAISANDSLTVTVPNYPNVAGYPSANFFNIYGSTASGTETLQLTVDNNKSRKVRWPFVPGGEAPPTWPGSNDFETYQGTVTANLTGTTTYNQTAAPLTTYPVPKGSSHQIDPTDPSRAGSKIECSSCHGPHTADNVKYSDNQATSAVSDPQNTMKYWVKSGTSDSTKTVGSMAQWCLSCHSAPGTLTQAISSTLRVPYTLGWPNLNFTNNSSGWFKDNVFFTSDHGSPSKGNYDCTKCHDQHGTREHLILKFPYDGFDYEGNCLRCHNGTTSAKNIKAEFQKVSRHPSLDPGFGGHEIDENYQGMAVNSTHNRHAECEDCHDPHSVNGTLASPPLAAGAIKNVTGVSFVSNLPADRPAWTSLPYDSSNYQFIPAVTNEYELCYKCHSSFSFGSSYPTSTSGAIETDIAKQFNPNNSSFHPVEAVGKNTTIPASSFVNGWTATSRLYCFDCHGDNIKLADGVTANPSLVRGPHGSINKFLLKEPYDSGEYSGTKTNRLCLMCHNAAVYDGTNNSQSGTNYWNSSDGNLHNTHRNDFYTSYGGSGSWFCGDCHGLYVHGQKRPNLIAYQTDPYPYGAWSAITKWKDPETYGGTYGETSCTTAKKPGTNQNCYGGHSGTNPYNP